MRFLIDAHLPMSLVYWLRNRGHDVKHTSELPEKNETLDIDIIQFAKNENRIVVSKDEDFYRNFILKEEPSQLLMVTTGNIVNKKLISLFEENIIQIEKDLEQNKVVELSNEAVTVHF